MIYLLDANVLIDANRDYYPIKRIPEFWEWLVHQGKEGRVKIPLEVYEEIKVGTDDLAVWAKVKEVKEALLLEMEADPAVVSRVVDVGYAPDLTDDEVKTVGRDPFLIGYVIAIEKDCCLVTTEESKPSKQRSNRKIPDVCTDLGVLSCHSYQFFRELDFRTGWKTK